MVIFSTLTSFTGFIFVSLGILALIYLFDAPIRRFEDRVIDRIRQKLFPKKKSSTVKKVAAVRERNIRDERIA